MANKTVMQKHLEWLKERIVVSPQMESQLLEEEKQQIMDAHLTGLIHPLEMEATKQAEQYYNETFNTKKP
jgi:hypothetical protein